MSGRTTTPHSVSRYLAHATRAVLAAVFLSFSVVLTSSPAQACPQDAAKDVAAAAIDAVTPDQAQPKLVMTAPSGATASPMASGAVCRGAAPHANGAGCACGYCAACSSAVLPEMAPVAIDTVALPHALPKPDGADLANPDPVLRPPRLLG